MNERLLQFIWQSGLFNKQQLASTDDEAIHIFHTGTFNRNQGPDFLDARIRIGATTWAGSVELHLRSSHWQQHGHTEDEHYRNVILHVVWEYETRPQLPFPTLELQDRVPKLLLRHYDALLKSAGSIPCGSSIAEVPRLLWKSWLERLVMERLEDRTHALLNKLEQQQYHWEAIFWAQLARSFGTPVNGDAFEKIAVSLPVELLFKHSNRLMQTEALLLGQAGLLSGQLTDPYPAQLQKEYAFLKKKYKLSPPPVKVLLLRMRPSGFPAIRLAQLARLLTEQPRLFPVVCSLDNLDEVKQVLSVTAGEHWHHHYTTNDKTGAYREKHAGRQLADSICINTIIPMLFCYGHYHREEKFKTRSLQWLASIKAESNTVTREYARLGWTAENALESQAMLQLKNRYCNNKSCLDCAVGYKILRGYGGEPA